MDDSRPLLIGATAADPANVVVVLGTPFAAGSTTTGWRWYALYSTYDALDRALLDGAVDVAWNAPMAHAQSLLVSGGARAAPSPSATLSRRSSSHCDRPTSPRSTSSGPHVRGRRADIDRVAARPRPPAPRAGVRPRDRLPSRRLEPRAASNGVRWIDGFLIFGTIKDGRADAGIIFEPWLAHLLRKRGLTNDDITIVWRSHPFCHCAFTARPELPKDATVRVSWSCSPRWTLRTPAWRR